MAAFIAFTASCFLFTDVTAHIILDSPITHFILCVFLYFSTHLAVAAAHPTMTSRCPSFISFICSPIDLLGDIIDGLLKGIVDGLLGDAIKEVFDALGFDALSKLLPDLGWYDTLEKGLNQLSEQVQSLIFGHIDALRDKLVPYLDFK
jgi:hypothetical protein